MRARDLEAGLFAGARVGVERRLVGIGGAVEPEPVALDEALELVAVTHGPKAARMLERFASLPVGTLVWTRTGERTYRLGAIAGPWRYDGSRRARAVGIVHVRATAWAERELGPDAAPAAVVRSFARGGRNFQRTHDREAEERSARLWAEGVGTR